MMTHALSELELSILGRAKRDLCGIVWEPLLTGKDADEWNVAVSRLRLKGYLILYPRGGHVITREGEQAYVDLTWRETEDAPKGRSALAA
jgi:hypothetical protein